MNSKENSIINGFSLIPFTKTCNSQSCSSSSHKIQNPALWSFIKLMENYFLWKDSYLTT